MMEVIKNWFSPNGTLGRSSWRIMLLVQTIVFFLLWQGVNFPLLPKPAEIVGSWWKLINDGLAFELISSLVLCMQATAITVVISLFLVYSAVMPFFKPWTTLFSKLRFNGLVGLTLFFTLLTSGTHELKLLLLTTSMTVWFVTMMAEEIRNIPSEEYEHARTLGMPEWRVVWEVVILGKLDRVVEVLRQNTAISWLMLTTVEGLVRTEGGIGAMLLVSSKYLHVSEVLAIQLTILLVGISLDWLYGFIHRTFFPYVYFGKEERV